MRVHLRLLRYLAPYRRRLTFALVCMLLYAASSTVTLGTISPLMQVLFERTGAATAPAAGLAIAPGAPSRAGEALAWRHPERWGPVWRARIERGLREVPPLEAVGRICLALLIMVAVKNLTDYLQSWLMVSVEQSALGDLRDQLHRHLHQLPLSYFHAQRTGVLMSRLTNDFEYLRMALVATTSTAVKDGLTLIGSLAVAFYASGRLAWLALLILPPAGFALGAIGRAMRQRSARAQERMGELTARLQEGISGARVVKAFGAEAHEQRRFEASNRAFTGAYVRMRRIAAAARPVTELGLVTVAVALLWLGAREIFLHGSLPPHRFVLFVMALLGTVSPIRSLADVNTNVQQGVAAAERVFAMLDTEPDVADRPAARPLDGFRDRIRLEHVTFRYGDEAPALDDVSLEIRRGEVVALVGTSGAGKSTLMDLIPRFHDPTEGRVTIDGADLRDLTLASLRDQLGLVTQETFLFRDTVRANIAYARDPIDDVRVRAAARAAHADGFIERLPGGYESVIGERGVTLSGGERQRLAIARAILRDPPILLLDEATSSLDAESERLVQEALERLMHDRTVLVIAHRLATIQHADRIVVLERGRVVGTGTHRELLEREGPYRRLCQLQFSA